MEVPVNIPPPLASLARSLKNPFNISPPLASLGRSLAVASNILPPLVSLAPSSSVQLNIQMHNSSILAACPIFNVYFVFSACLPCPALPRGRHPTIHEESSPAAHTRRSFTLFRIADRPVPRTQLRFMQLPTPDFTWEIYVAIHPPPLGGVQTQLLPPNSEPRSTRGGLSLEDEACYLSTEARPAQHFVKSS